MPKINPMSRRVNIVMIGGRGAGKTLYLASLYKKLQIAGNQPHNSFFIQIEDDKKLELTSVLDKIGSADLDWPMGSRGFKTWEFKCCVKNEKEIYYPFIFNYIDYAGGIWSDFRINNPDDKERKAQQAELEKKLRNQELFSDC